jgi:hypothetical protein
MSDQLLIIEMSGNTQPLRRQRIGQMQDSSRRAFPALINKVEPLALTLFDAERLSGLRRGALYRANARGELLFIKAGRKTLVDYQSLSCLIQQLPRFQGRTGLAR